MVKQGLVNVPRMGDLEHHFQVFVGDGMPNSWLMSNWDIFQALYDSNVHHLQIIYPPVN